MNPPASLHQELAPILAAVTIESPTLFHFAGRRIEVRQASASHPGGGDPGVSPAVAELRDLLYWHAYTHRLNGSLAEDPLAPTAVDPVFAAGLAAANAGRERFEPGWRIESVDASGRALASRHGKQRSFPPGLYGPLAGPLAPVGPGTPAWVFLAKGAFDLQPGFYVVFGESVADPQNAYDGLVRLYFNVHSSGAARLIAGLTGGLNRFAVPFSFKTLIAAEHYSRRFDGSVLFVNRRFFAIVAHVLAEAMPALAEELGAGTPLFTKVLAPGVGLAEDPGTGDSFGHHRCRLVSEALWSAFAAGVAGPEERLAAVAAHFQRQGLSLEKPFLNPRSIDRYDLPTLETGP